MIDKALSGFSCPKNPDAGRSIKRSAAEFQEAAKSSERMFIVTERRERINMALKKKPVTGMKDMLPEEMDQGDLQVVRILLHGDALCGTH